MEKFINGLQGGFYILAVICMAYTIWDLRHKHKEKKKKQQEDKKK